MCVLPFWILKAKYYEEIISIITKQSIMNKVLVFK